MGRETDSWQFCPRELAGVGKEGGREGEDRKERERDGVGENMNGQNFGYFLGSVVVSGTQKDSCMSRCFHPCNIDKRNPGTKCQRRSKVWIQGNLSSFSTPVKILWACYSTAKDRGVRFALWSPTLFMPHTEGKTSGLILPRHIHILFTR